MSPGAFLSFSGRCFRCPFGYTLVLDTLCLYHGEEKWDGPRSLKDMMDFGADGKRQKWEDYLRQGTESFEEKMTCTKQEIGRKKRWILPNCPPHAMWWMRL